MPTKIEQPKGITDAALLERIIDRMHAEGDPSGMRTPLEQRARSAAALDWLRSNFGTEIEIVEGEAKVRLTPEDAVSPERLIKSLAKPSELDALSDEDWQTAIEKYRDQLVAAAEKMLADFYKPATDWLTATYGATIKRDGKGEDKKGDKKGGKKGKVVKIGGLPLDRFCDHEKPSRGEKIGGEVVPEQVADMLDEDWKRVLDKWIDEATGGPEKRDLQDKARQWLDDTYGYRIRRIGYRVRIAGFDSEELRKRDKPSKEEAPEIENMEDADWKAVFGTWINDKQTEARADWTEPTYADVADYLDEEHEDQVHWEEKEKMIDTQTVDEFKGNSIPDEFDGLPQEKWEQYIDDWLEDLQARTRVPTMADIYNISPTAPEPELEIAARQVPLDKVMRQYQRLGALDDAPARRPDQSLEEYLAALDAQRDEKQATRGAAGFVGNILAMLGTEGAIGLFGRRTRLKAEAKALVDMMRDIKFERDPTSTSLQLTALMGRIEALRIEGLARERVAPLYKALTKIIEERGDLEDDLHKEVAGILEDYFKRKRRAA